ncbi:MAG: ankyrin repeat domain-containing protein [Myxococcota bacterium]
MNRAEASEILARHGYDARYLYESARHGFQQACKKGPVELIEAFLVSGLPIRAATDSHPAAVRAAESGKVEHLDLLLRHGALLEATDFSGDTALHTAANWGHVSLVRALAARGAKLDTMNNKKWTPLSHALSEQKSDVVRALLESGASPDFGREHGASPISFSKSVDDLRLLLDAGAEPHMVFPETGNTLLSVYILAGRHSEAELLLKHGAKDVPNLAGWTAWMAASDPANPIASGAALLEPNGEVVDTSLVAAARAGDIARIDALLERGVEIDTRDRFGSTAIFGAAAAKKWDCLMHLLRAGADPSISNVYANAPLTFAASVGRLDVVQALLDAGAPANEGVPAGAEEPRSLALVLAASAGSLEIVRTLVDAGADLASRDKHEQTAVFLAASKGRVDVLRFLLERGADPDLGGRKTTPLLIATSKKRREVIELLVAAGANTEVEEFLGRRPLHMVSDGYLNSDAIHGEIAKVLVDAGADVGAREAHGDTPYDIAKLHNNEPVVRFFAEHFREIPAVPTTEHLKALVREERVEELERLLERGLSVERFQEQPRNLLFEALGSQVVGDVVLRWGADPHTEFEGETTLMVAAGAGQVELVRALLDAGVDVDRVSYGTRTAIGSACSAGSVEIVRLLLAAGANVNPVRGGWSPLMRAAQRGNVEIVTLLLEAGADANVVNNQKQTALEIARKKKHDAVVTLLTAETDLNQPDKTGRTPLHHACIKGDVPLIERLLAAGADLQIQDADGKTANEVGARRLKVANALGIAHQPLAIGPLSESPFRGMLRGQGSARGVNSRGDTPLHIAVLRGDGDAAEELLAQGADVHAANRHGDTPWALSVCSAPALEAMLKAHGARIDVNQQVSAMERRRSFRARLREGDLKAVDRMLEEGEVHPHLLGSRTSPLTLAVAARDAAMVRQLLTKGCDPEVVLRGAPLLARGAMGNDADVLVALLDVLDPTPDAVRAAASAGSGATLKLLLEADASLLSVEALESMLDAEALRVVIEVTSELGLLELMQAGNHALRQLLASRHYTPAHCSNRPWFVERSTHAERGQN